MLVSNSPAGDVTVLKIRRSREKGKLNTLNLIFRVL